MAHPITPKSSSPVGESKPRIDAREKVTGAALYADDIQFGNKLLYARIKRSPYPHALIKKIDVSRALALPGVKAVVTGQDFPGFIGLYLKDRHIFCRERVRYVGDPVAGVAAINPETAEKQSILSTLSMKSWSRSSTLNLAPAPRLPCCIRSLVKIPWPASSCRDRARTFPITSRSAKGCELCLAEVQ